MLALFNGMMTILAMFTFAGIVWWAWSAHRAEANKQASMLPFALPEEYQTNNHEGDRNE